MGERAIADPGRIPDFSRIGDPAFAATGTTNVVKANFELINDNLMDLSHVGYVHGSTIGTTEMGGKAHMKTERTDKGVRVTRWVIDCPPPPTYLKTGIFSDKDRIDRWQIIDFEPPCFITIHVGGALTGTGAPEGQEGRRVWHVDHERNDPSDRLRDALLLGSREGFCGDNPAITKAIHTEVAKAFEEDRHILEEQQKVIHMFVDPENVDIAADAGSVQARRVLRQRLAENTAAIA